MRPSRLAAAAVLVVATAACVSRRTPGDRLVPVTVRVAERSAQLAVTPAVTAGVQLVGGVRQIVVRRFVPATRTASGCRFDTRATTARVVGRDVELRAETVRPLAPGSTSRGFVSLTDNPASNATAAVACTTLAEITIANLDPGTYAVRFASGDSYLSERAAIDSVSVTR